MSLPPIIPRVIITMVALTWICKLEARVFTSADGTRNLEAEIVAVDAARDHVTLRTPEGRIIEAKITAFSPDDQKILTNHSKPAEEKPPPPPATPQELPHELIKELRKLSESSNAVVRQFDLKELTEKVSPMLDPESHHVMRRIAAKAAGSVPAPELVPLLIKLLDDRIAGNAAHISLIRLSGQYLGGSKSDWQKWWTANREGFTPVCLSQRKLEDLLEENTAPDGKPDPERATFYGREVTGSNIFFLLDISGSMNGPRIERLKLELSSAVGKLPRNCRIGFIFFPHPDGRRKTSTIEKETYSIELATEEFKANTLKEISELEAGGATPMRNAIEAAFDTADSGQLIDTLYILSDGEPTDASASNVLRTVSKRNKDHYMVIHTIAIGEDSALLKTISQEHEGNHIWSSTGKF